MFLMIDYTWRQDCNRCLLHRINRQSIEFTKKSEVSRLVMTDGWRTVLSQQYTAHTSCTAIAASNFCTRALKFYYSDI